MKAWTAQRKPHVTRETNKREAPLDKLVYI
jgi:hypothetical protein